MPKLPLTEVEKKRRRAQELIGKLLETLVGTNETVAAQKLLDLSNTAERVARMLVDETLSYPAEPALQFTEITPGTGDIVAVSPIGVASTCAHHMMPFNGHAHIAYLAHDKLLGLSKFARIVRYFAKRFQLQERLTQQVADYLMKRLDADAVLVLITCTHGCVSCRGVYEPDMRATTSALRLSKRYDTRPDSVITELYSAVRRNGFSD